jgi:hypothetical protein
MSVDLTFYVYGWYTLDGVCFYVGKGKDWRYKSVRHRNKRFLDFISKNKYEIKFFQKDMNNEDALKLEIKRINELKPSCNAMIGGVHSGPVGLVHSEETRAKIKEALRDEGTRALISMSKMGKPRPREVIEKMVATRRANGLCNGNAKKKAILERRLFRIQTGARLWKGDRRFMEEMKNGC